MLPLNSVGVQIQKIHSGFWRTAQNSCWENHERWMELCGDSRVEQMGGI